MTDLAPRSLLATLGRRLGGDGRVGRWLGRGAGLLFVVLGLRLALGEER